MAAEQKIRTTTLEHYNPTWEDGCPRDYILGFIFYKYLSTKMDLYANTIKPDGLTFQEVIGTDEALLMQEINNSLLTTGLFLEPDLFSELAKRKRRKKQFHSGDLALLTHIEQSTMGAERKKILETYLLI
jgi:type I restriction enzyme M protein